MAKSYNGHRSWNAWNVALWINNEYALYELARNCCKGRDTVGSSATLFIKRLGETKTPDGASYNHLCVKLAIEDIFNEVNGGEK